MPKYNNYVLFDCLVVVLFGSVCLIFEMNVMLLLVTLLPIIINDYVVLIIVLLGQEFCDQMNFTCFDFYRIIAEEILRMERHMFLKWNSNLRLESVYSAKLND